MKDKNQFVLVLTLIISFLIFSGCDSTNSSDSRESKKTLIPLTNSNSWTFVSESGNMEAQVKIGTQTTINDHKAYEVLSGIATNKPFYVRKSNTGIYIGQGEPYAEFLLKYPIENGSTYEYTDQEKNEYTITANRKSISVPAGDFSCLNYQIIFDVYGEQEVRTVNVCISPDIGPVLFSESTPSPTESDYKLFLSSYNLN